MSFKSFLEKRQQKSIEKKKRKEQALQAEIQAMADLLTTKAEYKKAVKENEKLFEKIERNRFSARDTARAKAHMEKLDKALEIAAGRGYEWQFIPSLSIDLSVDVFEYLYKRIKDHKTKDMLEKLYPGCCYALEVYDPSDDMEEAPAGMTQYKKLITDFNSENDIEKQAALLDKFDNKYNQHGDYDLIDGEYYLVGKLKESKVPKPDMMIEKGYNTPEKCFNIPDAEFKSWEGVGKITYQQFLDFKKSYANQT